MNNIGFIKTSINTQYDQNIIELIHPLKTIDSSVNINIFSINYDLNATNKTFTVLPVYECKYFFGNLVVWDPVTLDLVLNFPNIRKIVYIHDNSIPWRINPNVSYKTWEKLFDNTKTQILITDKYIADIFRLTWGTGQFIETINPQVLYEKLQ